MYYLNISQNGYRSLIANCNISKGTVVIKEYPFLTCEDVYDGIYQIYSGAHDSGAIFSDSGAASIKDIFENFTPNTIDKYTIDYLTILSDLKTLPKYMQEFFEVFDINTLRILITKFHRNAFTYKTDDKPCALLQIGSLINHSCQNNLDFYVDNNGYFVFIANRNIESGEELCDSYLTNNSRISKPKCKYLLFQYGFIHSCELCN